MNGREAAPVRETSSAPDFDWKLPLILFLLTVASTTYVQGPWFSAPLMLILLCHEFGHYIAARIHRVPASLPYFIPMPLFLGTMGAVILMPERIRSKNALLDIGAAGPLCGMVIALPVLIYGIAESPVQPQATELHVMEGHSLLYEALLYWLKGPFPPGHDIHLTPTAFAGWVGLLVTMLNLIPAAQLDGGHVAHALLGERHERFSKVVRWALIPVGVGVALYHGLPPLLEGRGWDAVRDASMPGMNWIIWFGLLAFIVRGAKREHPPTDDTPLSPGRRLVALFTLLLFFALLTPAWLRVVDPSQYQ